VKSRSNTQLDGGADKKLMTAAEVKSDCDPVYNNNQTWENQRYSYKLQQTFQSKTTTQNVKPDLDLTAAATPCGLIAKSLFNDTYQIRWSATKAGLKNMGGTNVTIS
jgi:hypothetical protein